VSGPEGSRQAGNGQRDDEREAPGREAQESNGRGSLETVAHATDARVEQGLEVEPVSNRRNDEGEQKGGDTWKAASAGKALEGRASARKPRTT